MFPYLQIGPVAIQTPGLILILGVWFGISSCERLAFRFNFKPNDLSNTIIIALITGLIGSRLSFLIQNFNSFINNPLDIFSTNSGLFDPGAGFALGLVTALIYANKKHYSISSTLDALSPFFTVIFVTFWLSQFASGNLFGTETTLPWGVFLWGTFRHPVQLYYALIGIVIFILLFIPNSKQLNQRGITFLAFLALCSFSFLFLDAFREDTQIIFYHVRLSQVIAWLILAVNLSVLRKRSI